MRVKKREEEPFEIMLIPMIDCMLVIIIFFLVATTMKSQAKELPMDLPVAAGAINVEQKPDVLVIGVDRNGVPYLNTGAVFEPVDTARLQAQVRATARANPDQHVRIDADRGTRYDDFIRIVDLCTFEGLKNVSFHTRSNAGR